MDIGDWETTRGLNETYRQIRELDLEQNVAELSSFGFTVVPPDKVAAQGFAGRMLDGVLGVVEQRTGIRPDPGTGERASAASLDELPRPMDEHFWLVFEDQVFRDALLNPVALALASFLVGQSCVLSVDSALIKGPTMTPLYLHCDEKAPGPFPAYAQFCNTTWLLTDYSKDNGALCFVPGSHRWGRHPTPEERFNLDQAVPVEAPKGSLVVWGGNMWHGAFPRTNPGLRVSMLFGYARYYQRPAENFRERVTKEMLDANSPRFAKLMGQDVWMGFEAEGPDQAKIMLRPTGLYD